MNGTQQRELPYAWVIVALAALIFAVSSGLRSTISLLVQPWTRPPLHQWLGKSTGF